MKWVIALLGVLLGMVTLVFGLEIGSLRSELNGQEQYQAHRDQVQLRMLQAAESRIDSQLAGLTVPTDPLSAYDAVCNQDMTNSLTGITQTYYFPCTNSAQTIPQPSGG